MPYRNFSEYRQLNLLDLSKSHQITGTSIKQKFNYQIIVYSRGAHDFYILFFSFFASPAFYLFRRFSHYRRDLIYVSVGWIVTATLLPSYSKKGWTGDLISLLTLFLEKLIKIRWLEKVEATGKGWGSINWNLVSVWVVIPEIPSCFRYVYNYNRWVLFPVRVAFNWKTFWFICKIERFDCT